jgi:hypothetical protein
MERLGARSNRIVEISMENPGAKTKKARMIPWHVGADGGGADGSLRAR